MRYLSFQLPHRDGRIDQLNGAYRRIINSEVRYRFVIDIAGSLA